MKVYIVIAKEVIPSLLPQGKATDLSLTVCAKDLEKIDKIVWQQEAKPGTYTCSVCDKRFEVK